jgi:transglutaminase-like putative cysteine protease
MMIENLKRALGLAFYTKPQEYRISFGATITNKANRVIDFWLVMPLPRIDQNQELLSDISFSHEPKRNRDDRYGNEYVAWKISLLPGKHEARWLTFNVKIKPVKIGVSGKAESKNHIGADNIYLGENNWIQPNNPEIKKLAGQIAGRDTSLVPLISKINSYIIENLKYGNPIKGLYPAGDALEKDKVDCGGYNTLFVSLARAVGIPARVVSGFWAGYQKSHLADMHAWAEVMLPSEEWYPVDPSTEQLYKAGRTRKYAIRGYTGSDRIAFSHGSGIPIRLGEKVFEVDILQNPVILPSSFDKDVEIKTIFDADRI